MVLWFQKEVYLHLERLEDAQSRGAKIIAEVIGYRINSDASDHLA